MKISITGKQIDVGEFLRRHVETAATAIVERYFDRAIEAHVVFYRERHLVHADVSVHAGRGLVLQCCGAAGNAYAAFDSAGERLDKQLRRCKRRLRKRSGRIRESRSELPQAATADVLAADGATDRARSSDPGIDGDDRRLVIAEMRTGVPQLSVSEAVARLDVAALPALLFRNSAHGTLNMVYRRPDGNIGWIDPELVARRRDHAANEAF